MGMRLEPAVALGLVGVQVVENDMDLAVGIGGHHAVHEVEELTAAPPFVVSGLNLAAGDVESGKQRRRAVSLIGVAMADQGAPVRQLQIALGALQRLDARLLVDRQHDGVLRRVQVEADDLGRLGDELGIVALAPGFTAGQVDLLPAQEAPDVLVRHIAQRPGQQWRRPASEAGGRRLVQLRQDAPARLGRVDRRRPRPRSIRQPGQPFRREARAPAADPPRPGAKRRRNGARRAAVRRQQHHAGALAHALFRLRRSDHALKHRPLLLRQYDRSRVLDVHPSFESRLRRQR